MRHIKLNKKQNTNGSLLGSRLGTTCSAGGLYLFSALADTSELCDQLFLRC
ncbi:hypothetical protein GCE9029_00477 [Grimontia celer]|uniref:Uncharacterized protein n=1 Tax=Grimontia celer TaxID=1796497 RepID=A0A128EUN5_9GAMM|nr:hypothetical protein GCE9029_00477 [Grimontia celer]